MNWGINKDTSYIGGTIWPYCIRGSKFWPFLYKRSTFDEWKNFCHCNRGSKQLNGCQNQKCIGGIENTIFVMETFKIRFLEGLKNAFYGMQNFIPQSPEAILTS